MFSWRFSSFYFFYFCALGVLIPYWSLHLQDLGFSATQIGELMSILLLTKIIAPNLWAVIADNLKAKTGSSIGILKFATGITFAVFCMMFWAESYWQVAFAMFGFCLFWNACLPQLEAATLNHLLDSKHHYGRIRLWGSIGFIITVLMAGRMIDLFGTGIIVPSITTLMFILFLASFLLSKKDEAALPEVHIEEFSIRKLITPSVICLLALCFFSQIAHSPFYSFYSIYMLEYGYNETQIGWLWSVGVVGEIIIFLISYRILIAFPLRSLLSFTFFVACFRWYIIAKFPEYGWLMVIAQLLHAITYGLYHGVMIQLIDRHFKGRYQVRGQALYSSITFGFGGAIGSMGSGYIWSYYGQQELFMFCGWLMLLVALCSLVYIYVFPKTDLVD